MVIVLCALVLMGGVSSAQQDKKGTEGAQDAQQIRGDGQHYRVAFVVQEVEGSKVINARKYVTDMTVPMYENGSIRSSSRVPVITSSYLNDGKKVDQYTYVDLGFNVDFKDARLEGDKLFLVVRADLSTAETPEGHQPVIRQNKWDGGVTVPLGKPTVIFTSDDMDSKRTLQLELTVTLVR